jgi:hypothetical protein
MSNGCDTCSETSEAKTGICPANGRSYSAVPFETLLHQLSKPWASEVREQAYYFCTDPECDVVYFGADRKTFRRHELRFEVGQKSRQVDRPVCYCFDISQADIERDGERTRSFVVERTRDGSCDCKIRNPSGQCCLKDFPK